MKEKNWELLKWTTLLLILIVGAIGIWTFNYFSNESYKDWVIMLTTIIGAFGGGVISFFGVVITLNREYEKENILKAEKVKKIKIIIKRELELFIKEMRIKQIGNIYDRGKSDYEGKDEMYKIKFNFKGLLDELILLENKDNIDYLILIREKYDKYLEFENIYHNNRDRSIVWEYFNKEFLGYDVNIARKKFIYSGYRLENKKKFINILEKENYYNSTINTIFEYLDRDIM